jgi:hypothetical protein
MAGRTLSLGKGLVLHLALLPALYFFVTGGAESRALLDQKTLVRAAVGLVAISASALGHRLVDDRSVFLPLNIAVTLGAQRTGALSQQTAVAGHMRVVTGCALAGRDRCVHHSGLKGFLEVVAAEADLLLVDLLSRPELTRRKRDSEYQTDGYETGDHDALRQTAHWAPPESSAGTS